YLPRQEYTTAHHYFRVALDRDLDPETTLDHIDRQRFAHEQDHRSIIRDLVQVINRNAGQLSPDTDSGDRWQIIGATPHWFTSAAGGYGGPWPGPPPELPEESEPSSPGEFIFLDSKNPKPEQQKLRTLVEKQRRAARKSPESGVIVAILDQSPSA